MKLFAAQVVSPVIVTGQAPTFTGSPGHVLAGPPSVQPELLEDEPLQPLEEELLALAPLLDATLVPLLDATLAPLLDATLAPLLELAALDAVLEELVSPEEDDAAVCEELELDA